MQQPWEEDSNTANDGGGGAQWAAYTADAAWAVNWQAPQLNDPMLNAGLQAGKAFMDQQLGASLGSATLHYTSYTAQLKALYFNVNNAFVLAKLRTLLFPFAKKDWAVVADGGEEKHGNAPDLYVPLMALSTYVLAVGLAKGGSSSAAFNPEIIVEVFGSSIFCQAVQVVGMKCAAFVLLNGTPSSQLAWLDLVAFSGYQYVGVAINMLVGVCFGALAYNFALLWTAACASFVMFKTMQRVVGGGDGHHKKLYFALLCAGLQVALMWFLGFTRELRASDVVSVATGGGGRGGGGFASSSSSYFAAPPVSPLVPDTTTTSDDSASLSTTTTTTTTTKKPQATAAEAEEEVEEEEDDDAYAQARQRRQAKRKAAAAAKKQQQQRQKASS